jgi:hypothetical protein
VSTNIPAQDDEDKTEATQLVLPACFSSFHYWQVVTRPPYNSRSTPHTAASEALGWDQHGTHQPASHRLIIHVYMAR